MTANPTTTNPTTTKPTTANNVQAPGILLGIGLGGFVDGIVVHQVLQWHHMISNRVPVTTVAGLRLNTLADGLFHAATWVAVVAGVALLWARVRRGQARLLPARALWGWAVVGWGGFNLVEGVVDHQLLQLHHVRPGPSQLAWDLGFLAFGAALVVAGWLLQRSGARSASSDEEPAERR